MQVFKAFFKSLYVHRTTVVIYLFVFVLIALLMGWNSDRSSEKMFASEDLSVAVIDKDGSPLSRALVQYLGQTEKLVTPRSDSPEQLKDDASFGVIDYALIINKGAAEKIASGEYEGAMEYVSYPQSAGGYLMSRKINSFIKNVIVYEKSGIKQEDAIKLALAAPSDGDNVEMAATEETGSRKAVTYFFQYVAYAMVMMLIIGISSVMAEFKKPDLVMRLDSSALKKSTKNIQLIISYFITGIFVWAAFMILSFIFYRNSPGMDRIGYFAVNSFVMMIIGLSLAFLIGSFISNENIINMVANALVMGMSFVSGIFVEQQYMDPSILSAARFLPTYWYVKTNIIIRDSADMLQDMTVFWRNLGMELLFAAVFIAVGAAADSRKIRR